MDEWSDLLNTIDQIQLKNQSNIRRQPGFFKKIKMQWETNTQTFFQFKEIYTHRLKFLKEAFELDSPKTIEDLSNNQRVGELIGLFKRIQAKRVRAFEPQYLDKYENHAPVFSQNDTFQLQDETGKVKLQIKQSTKINGSSKFNTIETPYGVIIKCKGEYSPKKNRFVVSNIETPKPAPQKRMVPLSGEPKYMIVMCEPSIVQVKKILDFIQSSLVKPLMNYCELVIIGGVNYHEVGQIRELDELLYELGAMIDTFIIPTSNQYNSYIYPQSPLHKSFFSKCYQKYNVMNCCNPQIFCSQAQSYKLNALVSCGQNLMNLKANCNIQDDLELMKLIIEYRHLCPSSVFSLPIESYNYDPLILDETPHLMIHGKCQIFASQFYERENGSSTVQTRLVGLSKGDIVQIDLTSRVLQTKRRQIESFKTY